MRSRSELERVGEPPARSRRRGEVGVVGWVKGDGAWAELPRVVLCAAPGEGGPRSAGGSVCSVVCKEPRRALGAAGVCKSLSSAKAGRCFGTEPSRMGSADPALQVRACPAVPQRVGVSPGPAPARRGCLRCVSWAV